MRRTRSIPLLAAALFILMLSTTAFAQIAMTPRIYEAYEITSSSLRLTWLSYSANSCITAGFVLRYEVRGSYVWTSVDIPNPYVSEYPVTGLLPETQYSFTIQRVCTNPEMNSMESLEYYATTLPAPNLPPVAGAGEDQTFTCNNAGEAPVTLTGTAESPSGLGLTYVWKEGTTVLATTLSPTLTLGLGTHTLTLTVTQDDAQWAEDTVQVTIELPAALPGPMGPMGPVGPAGPQGPAGADGATGADGAGLVAGSLLFLQVGITPPTGYTLLGTTTYSVKTGDRKPITLTVNVYVKQ